MAASLTEFGFRQPIVVDGEGVIIAGHTRWKAARKLELGKVPVHVAKDLTPEQARAYRLADNKSADLAEWDMPQLTIEISALQETGYDLDLTGFTLDEVDLLLADQTDPDGNPSIIAPDAGGAEPQRYIDVGDFHIPVTDEEFAALQARLKAYLETNGTFYGFFAEVLDHVG